LAQIDGEGYEIDDELRDLYEYVGVDPPYEDENADGGRKEASSPRQFSTSIIPNRAHKRNIGSNEDQDEYGEPESSGSEGSASLEPARKVVKRGKKLPEKADRPSTTVSISSEEDSKENISITSRVLKTPKTNRAARRLRSPGKNGEVVSPVRKRRTQTQV